MAISMRARHQIAQPAPLAFISYARSDGEQLALQLRGRLEQEHPGITLWHDRAEMMGGVGWWKQITDALDQVEFLIMVLTPAAMRSAIAAKEWRYARQQGVRVCPVAHDVATLDFDPLPRWAQKCHCYDLDREWESLVRFLLSTGIENRVPFMAPDLPDDYVDRASKYHAVASCLLDDSKENPQCGVVALQGSGGFGKTTLACAVCHDENVISCFDDGILWASLGEKPNVQGSSPSFMRL